MRKLRGGPPVIERANASVAYQVGSPYYMSLVHQYGKLSPQSGRLQTIGHTQTRFSLLFLPDLTSLREFDKANWASGIALPFLYFCPSFLELEWVGAEARSTDKEREFQSPNWASSSRKCLTPVPGLPSFNWEFD